jgi:ABC-type multidrug transport system permease subunit
MDQENDSAKTSESTYTAIGTIVGIIAGLFFSQQFQPYYVKTLSPFDYFASVISEFEDVVSSGGIVPIIGCALVLGLGGYFIGMKLDAKPSD